MVGGGYTLVVNEMHLAILALTSGGDDYVSVQQVAMASYKSHATVFTFEAISSRALGRLKQV
jgi:hypothetical protein